MYVSLSVFTVYTVEEIINKRSTGGCPEYLVKWEGYPQCENSWEPQRNLMCKKLVDKYEDTNKLEETPIPEPPLSTAEEINAGVTTRTPTMEVGEVSIATPPSLQSAEEMIYAGSTPKRDYTLKPTRLFPGVTHKSPKVEEVDVSTVALPALDIAEEMIYPGMTYESPTVEETNMTTVSPQALDSAEEMIYAGMTLTRLYAGMTPRRPTTGMGKVVRELYSSISLLL